MIVNPGETLLAERPSGLLDAVQEMDYRRQRYARSYPTWRGVRREWASCADVRRWLLLRVDGRREELGVRELGL